jgi:glutathione S-transferase
MRPEQAYSRLQTEQVFSAVSDRLGDGRKYLLGEMFSAADITFAALAAPVINPPEFSSLMPALEEAPQELATIINEFRLTPAGAFALRLYREERRCTIA